MAYARRKRGSPGLPLWRWWISRVFAPLLFGAAATALVACVQSASTETGLNRLERDAYSWHLLHRPSRPAHGGVAVVAADDASFERQDASELSASGKSGKTLESYRAPDCDCPVPRTCYARAIRLLTRWKARGVVLDIAFRSRGHAAGGGARDEDDELAAAIGQAGNVAVIGSAEMLAVDRTADPLSAVDMNLQPPTRAVRAAVRRWGSPRVEPQGMIYAVEPMQTALSGLDGKPRSFYAIPYLAACLYRGPRLPGLGNVRALEPLLAEDVSPRLLGSLFAPARTRRPEVAASEDPAPEDADIVVTRGDVIVDEAFFHKRLLINFSSGAEPGVGRYFPVRLSRLLEMSDTAGRARFGGRLVIIGLPGHDRHKTAVGLLPGAEIVANAAATLIDRNPILPISPREVLLLCFCLAVAAAAVVRCSPAPAAFLLVVSELVVLQFAAAWLLGTRSQWLMVASPSASVLGAALGAGVWESNRVRKLVARLLPARISRLMERAGGFQVQDGTVVLSDIRGYSAFSERVGPATIMHLLNDYFAGVEEVLARSGGHFVKAPGDCVVAWFADEFGRPSHRQRAIEAGLQLLRNAERFQESWRLAGLHPFTIGVGINSGPMAVGVLDAHRHIEPTVIGDSVNLAARIETLTRDLGTDLLVSEETLAPVRHLFISESWGEFPVYGRVHPVRVHRIIASVPPKTRSPRDRAGRDPAVTSIGAPDAPSRSAPEPRDPVRGGS